MKNIFTFLHLQFRPRESRIIIVLLLLFNVITTAQETPATGEFPVGTQIGESFVNIPAMRDTLAASGLNTLYHRSDNDRKTLLEQYKLLAVNTRNKFEYIHHYSTCFYSKWEAEQNLTGEDTARVGFKHKAGQPAFWFDPELNDSVLCWSTEGLSAPACSLMYGPHYRQEKGYKRLYDTDTTRWELEPVPYVVRFNMALSNPYGVSGSEDVCKIKVVFRYKDLRDGEHYDAEFKSRVLKVSDFNPDSSFKYIYFDNNPALRWYKYPDSFYVPGNADKIVEPPDGTIDYRDWESFTGIQYWVEWLRNDNKCNLYINYVELYDNDGWKEYIDDPIKVADSIKAYAQSFSDWDNIIYWAGVDEPYVIDAYTPQHIVNSILVDSATAPPLVSPFNPSWSHDNFKINGEYQMVQYFNMAKPSKIHLSVNPCDEWNPDLTFNQLEWLRYNLQLASGLDPNFWFNAQSHGLLTQKINGQWCTWRKPKRSELKSMVMLALAHGAKGIMFFWFDSGEQEQNNGHCVGHYWDCIVDENAVPRPDSIYYTIKDNLVPRLKGTLGNTLMNLDYTGNYINVAYDEGIPPEGSSYSFDYLNIQHYGMHYHWHAGFLTQKNQPDNKHFLLTNLRTYSVESKLIVSNNTEYKNVSFTDIEGGVDTTIGYNSSITYYETMPAGEGKLYRVSPVILYGGRLLYDEYAGEDLVLTDDMIIENGKTLSISGNYFADGNIIIKNGSIVNYENGKIQFANGKKLIIEGAATISGIPDDKLILDFVL